MSSSSSNSSSIDQVEFTPSGSLSSKSATNVIKPHSNLSGQTITNSSKNGAKIMILTESDYEAMTWKNGLGVTREIAIRPGGLNFKQDDFLWRLSLSEVQNSCSLSVLPNYDIGLLVLPDKGMTAQKALTNPPALLYHNDHEAAVVLRPLIPYTYNGEVPTTYHVRSAPLRHLTILAHRKKTLVTINIEKICPHGFSTEGGCRAGSPDHGFVVPSPDADPEPADFAIAESIEGVESSDRGRKTENDKKTSRKATPFSKILLGNFTIIHVVRGAIDVVIDGEAMSRVAQGETLLCEKADESTPTDFAITPIVDSVYSAPVDEPTPSQVSTFKANDPSDSIHHSTTSTGLGIEGVTQSSPSDCFEATVAMFQINLVRENKSPETPNVASPGRYPFRRKGSVIVYDDQPSWNLESSNYTVPTSPLLTTLGGSLSLSKHGSQASLSNIDLTSIGGGPGAINLTTKHWESARHYRPPVMSARYVNESEVPPPVFRDTLDIDEFPAGKISTVWINMMKQGLSEWLRVPVIVARGFDDGPVFGITAAIHGNELNGVPCIHRVITDIDVHRLKGTVVAVPCVNVVGYLRYTREFSDGKDLNRLFPGSATGMASSIYAHNLMSKIITKVQYLIDLHTASFGRVNSYYVRSDMNDPVSATLAKLQQPQLILHNSGQDGTLRSAAMGIGIKAITVEIGNPQLFQNQYVQWSYMGVMRILAYLQMFSPNPPEPAPLSPSTVLCSKGFWLYTKTGGVLEVYPGVNTFVKKGDLVARIKNIFGNIVDEVYAPNSGITIGRSSNPVAQAGDRVLHMGIIKKENEALPQEAKENY